MKNHSCVLRRVRNEPTWQRRESGWVLNETMMRRHRRMDHDLSSFRYDRSSMGSNSIRASNSASSTLVLKTDAGFTRCQPWGSLECAVEREVAAIAGLPGCFRNRVPGGEHELGTVDAPRGDVG